MDLTQLPDLPAGRVWDVREFEGNEIQWHAPHTRVVIQVLETHRLLGIPFKIRDTTYPAYVVDPRGGEAELLSTAELMLTRHASYVANRAANEHLLRA